VDKGLKLKFFSLVLLVLGLSLGLDGKGFAQNPSETKDQGPAAVSEPVDIDSKLRSLSLDQKIGQLFIFGFNGQSFDAHMEKLLNVYKPGGLIVFSRNISSHQQIARLNYRARAVAKKISGLPLLIMVDQEGGSVTRIKTRPAAPSALALGMTKDINLIEQAGKISGEMLNVLGFNMNLAPVMDLSPPEKKNFIGNRSFGIDPDSVKLMAQAFADGQKKAHIIPTAKHFPGHGNVTQDSHKTLPVKLEDLEQLTATDLVPFKHFIRESYPSAIMIAHVAFPNIDPSGVPAAFSSILINDLLRDRLGYNGLVITDDIEMAGADSVGDIGERAIRAVEAGCDMIMVAWSPSRQQKALAAVKHAVETGRLSQDRIDDSLRRIILAKMHLDFEEKFHPSPKEISTRMATLVKDLKSLTHKVSYTNFKKSADNYPQLKGQMEAGRNVLIFSSDSSFLKSFRASNYGHVRAIPLAPGKADPVAAIVKKYPSSLFVYYVTGEGTARRIRNLSPDVKSKLVVVNSTNPGLIGNDEEFMAVFDIHSRDFEAGRWLAEFFFSKELRLPSSKPSEARNVSRRRRIPVN
jgi:beta-N-acetylhexosaminidase